MIQVLSHVFMCCILTVDLYVCILKYMNIVNKNKKINHLIYLIFSNLLLLATFVGKATFDELSLEVIIIINIFRRSKLVGLLTFKLLMI